MSEELKKSVRKLDLMRGALILTLILYIAVALVMNSSYLTVDRLMRLRSDIGFALSNTTPAPLDSEDTVDVVLFQDGYAVLTRNGVSVRSREGHEYSSHTLQYKQPCIKVCGSYLLCFDRGGSQWALLNSFRVLCSGTEGGNIINGAVTEDGYFAIAAERTEYKGSVTVYNTKGVDLSRWNSDTYLINAFFTEKNHLTVVSVAADRETTHTVFTQFNYKKGQAAPSVTAPDTFPLALALKDGGRVEMLTALGSVHFDGESVSSVYSYPEPSPELFCQGDEGTMISYQTLSGEVLVEGLSVKGEKLFSVEYPRVLSLGCSDGYYFILTPDQLLILDSSGSVVEDRTVSASRILVSPEISLLLSSSSAEALDLSSLP